MDPFAHMQAQMNDQMRRMQQEMMSGMPMGGMAMGGDPQFMQPVRVLMEHVHSTKNFRILCTTAIVLFSVSHMLTYVS